MHTETCNAYASFVVFGREFIELMLQHYLLNVVSDQLAALLGGFYECIPESLVCPLPFALAHNISAHHYLIPLLRL